MYNIGIDVGGMSIKAGIVNNGEIISKLSKETDRQGGLDKLADDIIELITNILNKNNIDIKEINTIGIGFPGVVAKNGGVTCVNLGLKNALVVPKIKEKFSNTRVMVGNDANVAALAEYAYGSMKGYESGVMITLGTGIGGGVVINGKLITGANGIGAEIGHMMISSNYFDCNCGNNGCFETFCSATAIIKYARKLVEEGRKTIIIEKADNDVNNITAKMVFDSYKENDEVAIEVVSRFRKYLAMGLANIINFIDPEVISIGGGVSNASDIMLEGLSEQIKKHLPFDGAGIGEIVIAKFKNDAGILGASAL
ncbi:ROK family protein [[Clostridium] dakarense]|uniref:ROK family protein n=1 Tax=Faecalimicrobium dakarense TaxID=1301100 RepID=UPI0004B517C7|nr:ROK family protein [[Clostridium] dakarense]